MKGQTHSIYRLACKYQPLEFKGTIDPVVALKWLKVVEKAITMFTMTDKENMRYATYLLKGDTKTW